MLLASLRRGPTHGLVAREGDSVYPKSDETNPNFINKNSECMVQCVLR
jgi:hypothetical protein